MVPEVGAFQTTLIRSKIGVFFSNALKFGTL